MTPSVSLSFPAMDSAIPLSFDLAIVRVSFSDREETDVDELEREKQLAEPHSYQVVADPV